MTTVEPETSSQTPALSIESFLNLITNKDPPKTSTTEVTISTLGTSGEIHHRPKKLPLTNRPTQPAAIRTSTENYDNNFLGNNQRSTVTVETTNVKQLLRSTTPKPVSSPYPFYPDRLDPGKTKPAPDNEVKWYYSNYNSETLEPYIDPRVPRDHESANAQVKLDNSAAARFKISFLCLFIPLLFSL